MSGPRVIVLAGRGESTALVVNGIKNTCSIERVIIENSVPSKNLIRRRIKTLGLSRVIGQLMFMTYNYLWLKRRSRLRIAEIKKEANLNDASVDGQLVTYVESVNSKAVMRIIQESQVDVIVVNGTRIISKEILGASDTPFVNTHVGITPSYRGVHGGYWALTENEPERCGVTVHLIDAGIDTGAVLHQEIIHVTRKDTFNTYPLLQIAAAIPLLKQAIMDVTSNTHETVDKGLPSKLWSHPTLVEYFMHRILRGVK